MILGVKISVVGRPQKWLMWLGTRKHQQFGTAMFIVGAPGHSWQNVSSGGMSIGQKSSIFASKVIAATVIDLLTKHELLRKAHEEWKERMKSFTYKSPLPPDLKPPLDQLPAVAEK